ncbi:MAG: TatD family hydrolase [Chloroflexi bacterium]|nr:TatD family hydrolase [Chloroflexota bacterium]
MAAERPTLTDTHCHLFLDQFSADRPEVIVRAITAGVSRILVPGIDVESSRAAIQLAEDYDEIYAAVGIHPNSAHLWNEEAGAILRELATHPKAIAIGEIGLDYYWDKTSHNVQEQVFQFQLELASEVNLPVVVHNREATQDILRKLFAWQEELERMNSPIAERPGVLHSFSGELADMEAALAANFYIGITGPVTFKKAQGLREVARRVAPTRLLIETDAPYLAPEPVRGQRNEPQFVEHIARRLSELRGISLERLCLETSTNADALLGWQN